MSLYRQRCVMSEETIELTAEQQLVSDIQQGIGEVLKAADKPTVVELGAFHAEDSAWMSPYAGRYIALEPDPRAIQYIRHNYGESGLNGITTFLEMAIAAHTGSVPLHLCDNEIGNGRASSSIRQPKLHLKFFPWCTFTRTVTVPCISLDDLYSLLNEKVELLWVDVQGAERDMIAGGREALKKTHYLFIEADDHEMYEGQANRATLLSMLPDWEIEKEFEYNLLMRNSQWPV